MLGKFDSSWHPHPAACLCHAHPSILPLPHLSWPTVPLALQAGGGLIVSLDERRAGVPASAEAAAAQWFSQDLFDDENLEDADEDLPPAAAPKQQKAAKQQQKQQAAQRRQQAAGDSSDEDLKGSGEEQGAAAGGANGAVHSGSSEGEEEGSDGGLSEEEEEEEEEGPPQKRSKRGGGSGGGGGEGASGEGGAGFEVVPLRDSDASSSDSDDSEDEFENLDASAKVGWGGCCGWEGGAASLPWGLFVVLLGTWTTAPRRGAGAAHLPCVWGVRETVWGLGQQSVLVGGGLCS